jgi:hypothetical protein
VPYCGTTHFADTRRRAVSDGADRTPVAEDVEALKEDIAVCFPALRPDLLRRMAARGCLKIEAVGTTRSNPDMVVFDEKDHQVRGLWVLFPGKASLAFALAREVGRQILASRKPERTAVDQALEDRTEPGAGGVAPVALEAI